MAIPSYTTDLTIWNAVTAETGFLELSGYTAGSKESIDPDLAIYGAVCLSASNRSSAPCSLGYSGSSMTLGTDDAVFVWQKFFAPNSLDTESNGGIIVGVGNTSSAYYKWTFDGSDTYAYGGWKNYAVSPTKTTGRTAVGSPSGTWTVVGVGWDMINGISKGNALTLDIIRYGRGTSIFTGGQAANYANFAGYATVNDNSTTGRFGLIQEISGGYLYKGLISLGVTATLVDFRDSNVNVTIDDTKHVSAAFNTIEIHNASSNIEWTTVSFISLGSVSRGNLEMVDNATFDDVGGSFTNMGTFIYQSNATITGKTFRVCDLITQDGATFSKCFIEKPFGSVGMLIDDLSLVTECTFISDGTGHAVDLGNITSTQSLTWDNLLDDGAGTEWTGSVGTTVGVAGTANDAILVNVSTSQTLTISVSDGATIPTVQNTGGGTVTIVAGERTFAFTLNPSITGYEWRIYTVTALGSLDGSTEIDGEEIASVDNQSYIYIHTSDTPAAVQIIDDDYVESITYYTLVNGDQSVTINLSPEDNV